MVAVIADFDNFGNHSIGCFNVVVHVAVVVVMVVAALDDFGDCFFTRIISDDLVHIVVTLACICSW